MASNGSSAITGTTTLPDSVRRLASVSAVDYGDVYTLHAVPASGSAEDWARAMLGDVPSSLENFVWHGLLRFRLHHQQSPAHIAGWRIGDRADEWIRLENSSWLMDANIIVVKQQQQQQVSLATMVRYKSPVAAPWWWLLSFMHRRGAPKLLNEGGLKMHKNT
ncbi:transcriptional activator protein DAL81 [Purpureocillium lavendulum]|uniref:Transcriptional activator protein DAL81 n=1 Tax=Purpureocillium lavendulum TaxID=1247861 RepID=A0AB34FS64_9HYPO|nr:transcriptional activator protein DAL81 [Purpureocillium lavendulum]